MRVVNRNLSDRARNRDRKLSAGIDVAEEHIGDRMTRLTSGKPWPDDGRNVRGSPGDRQRPPAHDDEDDGLAGGHDGFDQLLLLSGQIERSARARLAGHVAFFTDNEKHDIRFRGDIDRLSHLLLGSVANAASLRVHDLRFCAHALQHRDRFFRFAVRGPTSEHVGLAVGERSDHRDRSGILRKRQQRAFILEQHDRFLRNASRGIDMLLREHDRFLALFVRVRSLE